MNIAIIPARSGSKRIKSKNIKKFINKPVISYAIDNLQKSKLFKHIFVSTDSKIIAKISKDCGAEVPFLRPKSLADDFTPITKVIKNFIEQLILMNYNFDNVCCCFPCTPLLKPQEFQRAFKKFKLIKCSYLFPALKYPHPIQRAFSLTKKNKIKLNNPLNEKNRTQDLQDYYYDSGQFYFGKKNSWLMEKNIHSKGFFYPINKFQAIDIDSLEDWKFAESMYKINVKKNHK